jgi:hypothetical protein
MSKEKRCEDASHSPAVAGRFARNPWKRLSVFAKLWECVRVLAPLFGETTEVRTRSKRIRKAGTLCPGNQKAFPVFLIP